MKVIALEEHFLTTDLREAWFRLDPTAQIYHRNAGEGSANIGK